MRIILLPNLRVEISDCNRSSFALVVSCVQMGSFFLLLMMPMRDASGRSKSMKVGCLAGILRLRPLMDGILF
jgi:hypothetical protein